MHDLPNECTKYMLSNGLSIHGDEYDLIPATTQLSHVLMRLAFIVKKGDVPCTIELYDVFHFKLLLLDIYSHLLNPRLFYTKSKISHLPKSKICFYYQFLVCLRLQHNFFTSSFLSTLHFLIYSLP